MKYIFISCLLFVGCTRDKWEYQVKCDHRTIIEIGGCSGYKHVSCAVRLSDGSRQLMNAPLLGEKYCEQNYVLIKESK